MTIAPLGREATLEDLWNFDGPAELINGEIVPLTGTGFRPGLAAFRIHRSLDDFRNEGGSGHAISESVPFVLQTPRTQALIPDVAWFTGEVPDEEGFVYGPPALAVEVRSSGDYGPAAEREMALERNLYFAAGTQVVWDVDILRQGWIRAYHADAPDHAVIFARGEVAEAEPAVPGWRFPVDDLFD